MHIEPSDQDIRQIYDRIKEGIYDLQPDFQRDLVWNTEKQQKLIDSIIRGWQIPPIHLVKIEGKEMYEVLDGKQRLFAIYNFLEDKFPFNAYFIPGIEEFKEIHGKRFSSFSDEIKRKFKFTKIKIFEVSDVTQDEATELFLRLNLGVIVTAPEKRNCIYGPIKNFLRKEVINKYNILFDRKILGFDNLRMAYQDVLDKIFFLEKNQSLDNKPGSKALEQMYFEKKLDEVAKKNLLNNLELLQKSLELFQYKLTKSMIITYYWFLRDISKKENFDYQKASRFLNKFEEWRESQKYSYENKKPVHSKYVAFESYLSEGWLDPISLKGRHKILLEFYFEFQNRGKFGEVR